MQYLGAGGYILGDPYVATNNSIVTYRDAAKNGTITIDDDIVFEDGMAVDALDGITLSIERKVLCSESNALIELHVVAEDAGCTDDDTRTMVNGKVTANGGSRVYVDTSLAMGHLSNDARNEGYAEEMQLMSNSIVANGAYGRIAANHLAIARGSRITFISGYHIGGEQATQMRKAFNELTGNIFSFASGILTVFGKAETSLNLIYKFVIEAFDVDSRMVGDSMATDTRMTEVARKKDCTAKTDNLVQFTKRREGVSISMVTQEGIKRFRGSEFAHYLNKLFIDIHNAIFRWVLPLYRYNATHCSGFRLCVSLRSWNCIV